MSTLVTSIAGVTIANVNGTTIAIKTTIGATVSYLGMLLSLLNTASVLLSTEAVFS
jgi:hypothetical protein